MADEIIPPDLQGFILRHFESITQLEALLLLRANPKNDWTLPTITARLYAAEPDVAAALARLCGDGFLACQDGIYRYDGRRRPSEAGGSTGKGLCLAPDSGDEFGPFETAPDSGVRRRLPV